MNPFVWVTRVMAFILPIYVSFCLGDPVHGLYSANLCILLSGMTRVIAYVLPIYVSFFVWVTRVMASWYGEKQWDNREA